MTHFYSDIIRASLSIQAYSKTDIVDILPIHVFWNLLLSSLSNMKPNVQALPQITI